MQAGLIDLFSDSDISQVVVGLSVRMFVTFDCSSDKVHVCPIRANTMLTFDRVKLELLCPWWLPYWMAECKLCRDWSAHSLVGAHTAI